MADVPHSQKYPVSLPRTLRPAWKASDPATRCSRLCDALGVETEHQRLKTSGGDYWICAQTGQLSSDSQGPPPVELYDRWWAAHQLSEQEARAAIAKRRLWLQRLATARPGGRLLEVGSGQGVLLRAALELGWQAQGNEISAFAADSLTRSTGVPIHTGPIEEVSIPENYFDLVICDNVFEHLSQPMAVLKKLTASLREGGTIYLHTLNAQSLSVWKQPCTWHYFGDGHTFIPTLVSMRHYFRACGLEPLFLKTHGYRTGLRRDSAERSRSSKFGEKLLSHAASCLKLGHRVEAMLRRTARA